MAVFGDKHGRTWHVDVTVSALRRVRDGGLGIDLLDITDEQKQVAVKLADDPCLLVGVLFEVCRPEIEAAGLTGDQFGDALSDGEVIDAATTALLESLANFIPSHRGRAMARATVDAMRATENLGLMPAMEEALEKRGLLSILSPESSESIQAT